MSLVAHPHQHRTEYFQRKCTIVHTQPCQTEPGFLPKICQLGSFAKSMHYYHLDLASHQLQPLSSQHYRDSTRTMLDLLQNDVDFVKSASFDDGVSCATIADVGCDGAAAIELGSVRTGNVRACVVATITNASANDATAYVAFHTATQLPQRFAGLPNTAHVQQPYAVGNGQLTIVEARFNTGCVVASRMHLGSRLVYHIAVGELAARDVG